MHSFLPAKVLVDVGDRTQLCSDGAARGSYGHVVRLFVSALFDPFIRFWARRAAREEHLNSVPEEPLDTPFSKTPDLHLGQQGGVHRDVADGRYHGLTRRTEAEAQERVDPVPGLSRLLAQGCMKNNSGHPRDLVVDVHKELTLVDAVRPVSYGVGRRFDLRIGRILLSAAVTPQKSEP